MTKNQKAILAQLSEMYADSESGLRFSNPFELLIATILSAQSTDKHVNKVTLGLFARYPDAQSMAELSQDELEEEIRTIGLYKNKAKNILATCHKLLEAFDGAVPQSMQELVTLPGVGRKTANVVLCNAFHIPGFAVDTHVFRDSHRLGLSSGKKVEITEKELCDLIDSELWCDAHHWFIWHGRGPCKARNPQCGACSLSSLCPKKGVE